MSYITRRDGRYSYRRRFPNDVAELIGRTEYRKALGTADRTEALKLARVMSVEFDRICETALQEQAQAVASASTGSGDGTSAATRQYQGDGTSTLPCRCAASPVRPEAGRTFAGRP